MGPWKFVRIAGAALAACAVIATTAAVAAPLDAYGRLPLVETTEIAPDGAHVAMIMTDGESRFVVVRRLAEDKVILRAPVDKAKVRALYWAGPTHVIVLWTRTSLVRDVSGPRREWPMALSIDIATRAVKPLLEGADGMNVLIREPEVRVIDGKPYAFVTGYSFPGRRGVVTLFKVDLVKGSVRTVFTGDERTRTVITDARGEPVAQTTYDDRSGRWSLKLRTAGAWREVDVRAAPLGGPGLRGFGRTAGSVLLQTGEDDDSAFQEVSLVDGAKSAPAFEGATRLLFDPVTRLLIGYGRGQDDGMEFEFFDPAEQKVWKAVAKAFPGQIVAPESWTDDRKRIVVRVDSPTEGPAFALVDREKRTAAWLDVVYAGIREADIAEKRPITFKAADGLPLGGYLTLPRTGQRAGLPLVVFPHGGPASRDGPGFDWWAQAMASRGYAVLQVNYRGSDGLGADLLQAGYGQWGRKMQTDLSDGVRHLAKEGLIDPKRVCIVGASYGGYAALAGATIDRGVYRCAASVSGVTSLKRQVGYSASTQGKIAQRYWSRFMGARGLNDPILTALSPADLADKVEIPILLVHGKDDTVVPLEQSELMARALRKAGKPVDLVVLPGEDHWLTTGATRKAMLQAVVAFLEKHNPPK